MTKVSQNRDALSLTSKSWARILCLCPFILYFASG